MIEYRRNPAEQLTPPERPMPDRFYDLMAQINKTKKPRLMEISQSNIPPQEAARDKLKVKEKKSHHHIEETEYASFFETALPEVNHYDWFGENVAILDRGHGDAADYNDIKGTDIMLEMETTEEDQPIVLRVDVTKSNDLQRVEQKTQTTLYDIEHGQFDRAYFQSYYQEGELDKIDNAPRIIFHLTEDQLDELGSELYNAKLGKDTETRKTAITKLEESPLQINLIDQAKGQLESQALYALALFLEAINNNYRRFSLNNDEKAELVHFYEQVKRASDSPNDSFKINELIEEIFNNQKFQKFPRYRETLNILKGIKPWLDHFQNLGQEKNGQLSENVRQEAASNAALSQPHQLLTERPSQIRSALPEQFALAA